MKHSIAQSTEKNTERDQIFSAQLKMRRGDVVLAKVASGELVRRRVWGVGNAVVFLCSERLYKDLLIGASKLWPIGFPAADVQRAA